VVFCEFLVDVEILDSYCPSEAPSAGTGTTSVLAKILQLFSERPPSSSSYRDVSVMSTPKPIHYVIGRSCHLIFFFVVTNEAFPPQSTWKKMTSRPTPSPNGSNSSTPAIYSGFSPDDTGLADTSTCSPSSPRLPTSTSPPSPLPQSPLSRPTYHRTLPPLAPISTLSPSSHSSPPPPLQSQ